MCDRVTDDDVLGPREKMERGSYSAIIVCEDETKNRSGTAPEVAKRIGLPATEIRAAEDQDVTDAIALLTLVL